MIKKVLREELWHQGHRIYSWFYTMVLQKEMPNWNHWHKGHLGKLVPTQDLFSQNLNHIFKAGFILTSHRSGHSVAVLMSSRSPDMSLGTPGRWQVDASYFHPAWEYIGACADSGPQAIHAADRHPALVSSLKIHLTHSKAVFTEFEFLLFICEILIDSRKPLGNLKN